MSEIIVGIIMGSKSDLSVMRGASEALQEFEIGHEITVVSAHRTPDRMFDYARTAPSRGLRVIIAGAGGAAHLPGMVAAVTTLPVIGVPVKSSNSLDGWDSLLSIVQMPKGVPVASVAVNGAYNAGILAAQMISSGQPDLEARLRQYKQKLTDAVSKMVQDVTITVPPK